MSVAAVTIAAPDPIAFVPAPATPSEQANLSPQTLSVTVLPTNYAQADAGPDTYPRTVTAIVPQGVRVAAYGATSRVWFGPVGWTGNAAVGIDGSTLVRLFPIGGSPDSGPAITYFAEIGCDGCKIADAAPYFPAAMNTWNIGDNFDGANPIRIPKGLRIRRLSRTLVTYTLPSQNKLQVRGAAFYDSKTWGPFEEVLVKLAPANENLAEFLIKYFTEHRLQFIDRNQ